MPRGLWKPCGRLRLCGLEMLRRLGIVTERVGETSESVGGWAPSAAAAFAEAEASAGELVVKGVEEGEAAGDAAFRTTGGELLAPEGNLAGDLTGDLGGLTGDLGDLTGDFTGDLGGGGQMAQLGSG